MLLSNGRQRKLPCSSRCLPGGALGLRCLAVHTILQMFNNPSPHIYTQLDAQLGSSLEEHWGLDTLVRVGETWLPRMLTASGGAQHGAAAGRGSSSAGGAQRSSVASSGGGGGPPAADVPLLKLFEFLTASMCLYVIDDKPAPPRRTGVWAEEGGGTLAEDAAVGCAGGLRSFERLQFEFAVSLHPFGS